MKASEAPEKIYIDVSLDSVWGMLKRSYNNEIEYTRTDAFIEKACEFWRDHLAGYDICEDDIEKSVESFKLAMKL